VPYQIFQTKTGPLIVAAGNDRLFSKLANILGKPEWVNDPRYATNSARVVNRSTLEESLRAILATRAKEEWVAEFEVAGIPCAPVLTVPEVLGEQQTKALAMLQAMPEMPDVRLIGLPLSFDGQRPQPRLPSPKLGAHTESVLGALRAS
jgi:formyl-CoA transferase